MKLLNFGTVACLLLLTMPIVKHIYLYGDTLAVFALLWCYCVAGMFWTLYKVMFG